MYWNGKERTTEPPRLDQHNSAWAWVDCFCCGGYTWQYGEATEPEECRWCNGGFYAVHLKTGTVARYPGGPLTGDHYRGERLDALRQQILELLVEQVRFVNSIIQDDAKVCVGI